MLEYERLFQFGYAKTIMNRFSRLLFWLVLSLSLAGAAIPAFAQDENSSDADPVEVFNKGQEAHETGDFQGAIKFYDEALKISPEFPEAEFQKGNALVSLKQFDLAEKSFRRAIELREDWTLPMSNLGALLVKQNRLTEAEPLLVKAIRLDENNFPAFVALTQIRLRLKASDESLKTLLNQLKALTDGKARTPASVWTARASLERHFGDNASAKTSLSRSLSLEPDDVYCLLERSELALAESDFSRALEDAKFAAKLAPNELNPKILIVRIQADSGSPEEALKSLEALSENEKKDLQVVSIKNAILANSASGAEGVAALEKLLEANPKNASILGRLCVLSRNVDINKALNYCQRASEIEPNNINHAVGFGAALVKAKQFPNAINLFRKLLEIAPDNYTAHANLALSLFELKRYDDSLIEYQWLSDSKPDVSVTYYFMAIIHDNLGNYLDALGNYQKFLKLADPKINQLEIDKVNLRLPTLTKQADGKKGRKK